jgi:hypothetical protein
VRRGGCEPGEKITAPVPLRGNDLTVSVSGGESTASAQKEGHPKVAFR